MFYPGRKKKVPMAASGLNFTSDMSVNQRIQNPVPPNSSAPVAQGSAGKKGPSGPGIAAIADLAGGVGAAAEGINPDATARYNAAAGSDNRVDKLLPAAKKLPIIGGFVQGAAGISEAARGDGTNAARNIVADNLGGANTVKAVISGRLEEAIPIYGGFAKARRIRREQAKIKRREDAAKANQALRQSNASFSVLTFRNGGKIKTKSEQAVILGGKTHEEGGNPVVDAKSGEKVAETEREEILFTRSQTESIEKHIQMFDETKDERHLLMLGKEVKEIILNQTKDNSGKYAIS